MSEEPGLAKGYRVYVDDNFHFMDEDERWCLGEFASYDEALRAAKNLVEAFFEDVKPGQTAEELYDGYTGFGNDPFIVAFGGADQPTSLFSAWGYAKHLAGELEKKLGVPPPLSLPLCKNDPTNVNSPADDVENSLRPQGSQEDQ